MLPPLEYAYRLDGADGIYPACVMPTTNSLFDLVYNLTPGSNQGKNSGISLLKASYCTMSMAASLATTSHVLWPR